MIHSPSYVKEIVIVAGKYRISRLNNMMPKDFEINLTTTNNCTKTFTQNKMKMSLFAILKMCFIRNMVH